MRVLIVSNRYYPNIIGGAEKVVQNLSEGLAARGHHAAVATLNPKKQHEIAEINGVTVHYLPIRNLYFPNSHGRSNVRRAFWHVVDCYNPFMAASLRRVLDSEKPDVVNTHNIAGFSVSAWSAVKSRRLPLVHTAHDYYLLCPRASMFRQGRTCRASCTECRPRGSWGKRTSRSVSVATAPSRFVLDTHLRSGYFTTAASTPIYNCCESSPEVKREMKCDDSRPVRFGFLGQLNPIKGVERLIRSFMQLPPGQAELTIAGCGSPAYERELRKMANGHPSICWMGFVPPAKLLGRIDVLVVPSLWQDSAPLVVLEAMASGLPVIGSRRGGIPELVGEGTGWIFEPEDMGALTRTMMHAIELRSELAEMAVKAVRWAHRFSLESMVDGYLSAYSSAIEKNA